MYTKTPTKTQITPRLDSLDVLRFISILGVVLIHTTTRNLELVHLDITRLPLTFFLNQISRFAVPLFFLISGFALETSYKPDLGYFNYLYKRFSKILIPYLFWSLIYYYFVYTHHSTNFFESLLYGSSSYQLYFIPTLLIFYLIFPLLHHLYRFIFHPLTFTLLFLIQTYFLYTEYFYAPLTFIYPLSIALLNYLVFIIGIVAARHQNILLSFSRRFKFFIILLSLALGIYVSNEGRTQYLITHNYLSFYSQWRISIFLYTLSLFTLFFFLFKNKNWLQIILVKLSRLSFFVYFVHVMILEFMTPYFGHSTFFLFSSVFTLSFFIAYLIQKIPRLSFVAG